MGGTLDTHSTEQKEMSYLDQSAGGAEFVSLAKAVAIGRGRHVDTVAIAEQSARTTGRVVSVLRAASSAGTLEDPEWAGSLADYRAISSGFVESLRSVSAFDRLMERDLRRVPLRTRIASVTLGATGGVVGEGVPMPIQRLTLAGTQLEQRKATAIIVLADELMRSIEPGANAFLAAELRAGVGAATDADFVAGLIAGATSITSTGSDAATVREDFSALLAAVRTGAQSRLAFLMAADTAKVLATMPTSSGAMGFADMTPAGGAIGGVQVIVSDGIPDDSSGARVLLVDASRVAAGSDVVTLDSAAHATIQLDDSPTAPDAATTFTSLWQRNLLAVRASRYFGFEVTGTDSVAVLTGVNWGGS